jgi:hypothetical protein
MSASTERVPTRTNSAHTLRSLPSSSLLLLKDHQDTPPTATSTDPQDSLNAHAQAVEDLVGQLRAKERRCDLPAGPQTLPEPGSSLGTTRGHRVRRRRGSKGDRGCRVVFVYAWYVQNPLLGILGLPELDLRGVECFSTVQVRFPLSRHARSVDEVRTPFFYLHTLDHR